MSRHVAMVTFDCADAKALSSWWAERLEAKVAFEMEGLVILALPEPPGLALAFQTVPDPTPGKNRIHLDLHSSDSAADIAAFQAAGATWIGKHDYPAASWTVLADPEGNQFCIAAEG